MSLTHCVVLLDVSCSSVFDCRKAEEAQAARGNVAAEPRNGHTGQGTDNDVSLEADAVEDSEDYGDEAMPSVVDDVTEDAEEMVSQ